MECLLARLGWAGPQREGAWSFLFSSSVQACLCFAHARGRTRFGPLSLQLPALVWFLLLGYFEQLLQRLRGFLDFSFVLDAIAITTTIAPNCFIVVRLQVC